MMKFLNQWWLPALLLSLPFERIPSFDLSLAGHGVTIRLSMLIGIIGIVAYGVPALKCQTWKLHNPVLWLLLYLVFVTASIGYSLSPSHSLTAVIATYITIGTAIVIAYLLPRYDRRRLTRVILGVAAVVSLFGVYQFIGDAAGLPVGLTGLRENYIHEVFGFPRIQSVGLEPLYFANYLLLPVLLLAALLFSNRLKARYAWLLSGFVAVLALTLSRGGIAAAIIGAGVVAVTLWRSTTLQNIMVTVGSVVLGAAIAIGAIFITPSLTNGGDGGKAVDTYVHHSTQLKATSTTADSDRVVNKRLALEDFHDHILLGSGLASFGGYAQQKLPEIYPVSTYPIVNNEYHEVLAETGVVGATLLAGFVLSLLLQIIKSWKLADEERRFWIAVLGAVLIGYAVQYYAFSTLYIMNIWATIGLLLGLTRVSNRETPRP